MISNKYNYSVGTFDNFHDTSIIYTNRCPVGIILVPLYISENIKIVI